MDVYAENNGGFQAVEGASPFDEGSQFQGEGYTEMVYQEPAAGPAWYGEVQGAEGLPAGAYQETMMQAVGYDNAQGTNGLPAGQYQETVMQTAGDSNLYGTEDFSAVPYQEPAAEYGAEVYMGEADALPVAPGQVLFQVTEDQGMYQEAVSQMWEGFLAQTGMPQMEETVSDAGLEMQEMQVTGPQAAEFQAIEMQAAELEVTEPQVVGSEDADMETAEPEVSGQEAADSEMTDPETVQMETAETEIATEAETAGSEVPETEEVSDADKEDAEEDDEETRRRKHEAAEAERKAEWEEKRRAKKAAEREKLDRIAGMSDDAAAAAAIKQIGADTEKLTRRNMKACVAEYIQILCLEDPRFARMVMHPHKSMIHCFQYINRKAWDYAREEMKADGIKPGTGQQGYGCDVPDDLCYQWAEDYFRDPLVEEDEQEEEEFVPKPYVPRAGYKPPAKKKAEKKGKKAPEKKPVKKTPEKKPEPKKKEAETEMAGQLSLMDMVSQGNKAS